MAVPLLHVDRLARRYTRGVLRRRVTFSLEADFTIDGPAAALRDDASRRVALLGV